MVEINSETLTELAFIEEEDEEVRNFDMETGPTKWEKNGELFFKSKPGLKLDKVNNTMPVI